MGALSGSDFKFRGGTYCFNTELGLTQGEAEDVSDHYPIELQINGKANVELQAQLSTAMSFTVTQKEPVAKDQNLNIEVRQTAFGK